MDECEEGGGSQSDSGHGSNEREKWWLLSSPRFFFFFFLGHNLISWRIEEWRRNVTLKDVLLAVNWVFLIPRGDVYYHKESRVA